MASVARHICSSLTFIINTFYFIVIPPRTINYRNVIDDDDNNDGYNEIHDGDRSDEGNNGVDDLYCNL